jgi:hypothetical protein
VESESIVKVALFASKLRCWCLRKEIDVEVTRIEVLVGEYEDYCLLHTDVPGQWPTRRTNAEPFDTRKGNRLRLRFTTSGGKGVRYCKRHFPGVPIEIQREESLPVGAI